MVLQEVNSGSVGRSKAIGVEEPGNADGIYGNVSKLYVKTPKIQAVLSSFFHDRNDSAGGSNRDGEWGWRVVLI